jgi:hypothetical protein
MYNLTFLSSSRENKMQSKIPELSDNLLSADKVSSEVETQGAHVEVNSSALNDATVLTPAKKKYRNEYAKKGFFAVWNPVDKFLQYDWHTKGMNSAALEDYQSGKISGRQDCATDCACCLTKFIALPVAGLVSLLGVCGGFFVGSAKDLCCNSDKEESQSLEAPKQNTMS